MSRIVIFIYRFCVLLKSNFIIQSVVPRNQDIINKLLRTPAVTPLNKFYTLIKQDQGQLLVRSSNEIYLYRCGPSTL